MSHLKGLFGNVDFDAIKKLAEGQKAKASAAPAKRPARPHPIAAMATVAQQFQNEAAPREVQPQTQFFQKDPLTNEAYQQDSGPVPLSSAELQAIAAMRHVG